MNFIEGNFYHIYNRGNNKQLIFFQERNYEYFIGKMKKNILTHSDLIAWCLMPNHFHFLIQANSDTVSIVKEQPVKINALTEGIRILLSSYSRGIQKQEGVTGNLFQQKTRDKEVGNYLPTVFHYIHQNPLRAGLVTRLEDYKWSSFSEYCNPAQAPKLCKKEILYQFVDVTPERLLIDSYKSISDEQIKLIED
jgi:REP element-mobilizing transposase RayT